MAVTDYLSGTGTSGNPYIIHTRAALIQWLSVDSRSAGKYAALAADIDAQLYDTVGSWSWFGALNGYGFAIKNLRASSNWISVVAGGVIENVVIDSWVPYSTAGSATGVLYIDGGVMRNCAIIGVVSGKILTKSSGSITNVVSSAVSPLGGSGYATSVYILPGATSCPPGATDLRSLSYPYTASNYPALTSMPAIWVVDGASQPRLVKQSLGSLTQGYAVKGVTKVGSTAKSRKCRAHSHIDFATIATAISDSNGNYTIKCGLYSDHVYVTHTDEYGSKFKPTKLYALGDVIHPATPNGYRYVCTTAGTSSTAEPTSWPTTGTLTSGSAIFTALPVYKPETFIAVPVLIDLVTGLPV